MGLPGVQIGSVVARRYRVERLVGSGGAADVYEVMDELTDQRVALKRPGAGEQDADLAEVTLAREYSALAQLSHPLIIRAFDYGRDEGVPYYTMELLPGETLRQLAPLPWQTACLLLRDVASALGIVHSRRLVHRDVTTRNVCRAHDGRAKLLDFGALTPMGPVRDVVGTPPFVAPEALEEQRLDGRADLFALGAVAYFTLTRRHAYPARTFHELGDVWRVPPSAPSTLVEGIPAALDELILSLLSISRTARPRNAAEVLERLTAIADLPAVEGSDVARAYLSTPALVGQKRILARAGKPLERLKQGKGSALLVEGEEGTGRTRVLGAFLLEAKLRGFSTVRTSGKSPNPGPFRVIQSLARELLRSEPALSRSGDAGVIVTAGPGESDDHVQARAARYAEFFAAAASRTPLVVAVDDVDEADEHSISALSLLARRARKLPIQLVVTARLRARGRAFAALHRACTDLILERLDASDTRSLVSSLFGDVPHVEELAKWMHRLTAGNPRAALDLAQHLVDRGVATYQEGTWVLPPSMTGLGLPETIDQTLEAKLAARGPVARELVQTLALMTDHDPLLLTDYPSLATGGDLPAMFEALNELVAASVLVSVGGAYVFTNQELVRIARRSIEPARLPELHRKLARAYEAGSGRGTMLVTYHLHCAGDLPEAFRAAVRALEQRSDPGARGSSLARSRAGSKVTESLFVWGIQRAMPRRDLVLLGRSLLQLASVANAELARHAPLVLEPLRRETGLVHWDDFSHVPDPVARIRQCVMLAQVTYDGAAEAARGLDPRSAIAELATSAGMLVGVYTRELDARGAAELRALLEPLRALSPVVDVVAELVVLAEEALRGYSVKERRLRVFHRVSSPLPGMDDASRRGIHAVTRYYLALDEAHSGHEAAVELAAPLDADPHFAPLSWQVRMLVHLYRGDAEKAASARRKRDAARVGRHDVNRHIEASVITQAAASVILGDLLGLKRALPFIAERAERSTAWAAYHLTLKGSYHALRGEPERALEQQQAAVTLVPEPGTHAAWGYCVNALAATLIELERAADAEALVERALSDAAAFPIVPHVRAQLEMNLAVAKALAGNTNDGTALAARAMTSMLDCGTAGIILVEHYAKQGLVALHARDAATLEAVTRNIEGIGARTESVTAAAKLQYLLRQAQLVSSRPGDGFRVDAVTRKESHTTLAAGLRSELRGCRDSRARATRVLAVLLEWSGVDAGFFFVCTESGLVLAAASPDPSLPEALQRMVDEWLHVATAGATFTQSSPASDPVSDDPPFDVIGVVAHRNEGALLAGAVALRRDGPRRTIPESVLDAIGETLLAAGDAVGRALDG